MKNALFATAVAVAAVAMPAAASAATLVVDVTGSRSFAAFGSAGNEVEFYNVGANSRITGISYSVNITAFSPSYLSEAVLSFGNTALTDGVDLSPGFEQNNAGTASFSGSANLVDLGLDFAVGADGILRLEYYESFNDSGISPDAIWNSGTVTFTYETIGNAVPEPATWALLILGFGVIGGTLRSHAKRRLNVSYS